MNTDHFFAIGSSHKVCQDYAISNMRLSSHVIISDGCSSSPETDYGARLLARTASIMLQRNNNLDLIALLPQLWEAVSNLVSHPSLCLPIECLDASLGVIHHRGCSIQATLIGDGLIAAKAKDGTLKVVSVEFAGNAPVYLSYVYNPSRLERLTRNFDCTKIITETVYLNGQKVSEKQNRHIDSPILSLMFGEEYEFISIMSDGIQSFQSPNPSATTKTMEKVSVEAVLAEVLGYKNFNGQFVARRMNKYLAEAKAKGIHHYDDFSIGTLHC